MFTFSENPGRTAVCYDGDPMLLLVQEHVMFRTAGLCNAKFRPGGPVEFIALCGASPIFGYVNVRRLKADFKLLGPNRVRIRLQPEKTDDNLLETLREQREIVIEYLPDLKRFRYSIIVALEALKDIGSGDGLAFNTMPQRPGDDFTVIEFDDPLLSGGIGPQVPMTQDWTGLPEPVFSEAGFTTAWRKRYLSVTLPTVERGLRRVAFNRIVNGGQVFFNRTVPRMTPRKPFFYEKTDGRYLRFTPLFDYPTSHHICEWGYDMHLYAMVPRPSPGLLMKRGQRVELAYCFEEVESSEVPDEYLKALPAEIEPEERARADRPIYEEPVCRFVRSALDSPDQYAWEPGERCRWERGGGPSGESGALVIDNGKTRSESAWRFGHLGPSDRCNPIPPRSRFRVSALVKAVEPDKATFTLTLNHFNGPAMFSPVTPVVTSAGSYSLKPSEKADWLRLDFVSKTSGSYTLSGSFHFAYTGVGVAALSELRIERL